MWNYSIDFVDGDGYITRVFGLHQMRIIIGGAGQVGRGVASALRQEGRDIVLIDNDLDAINESQSIDCLIISGSVLSRRALVKAGITDAEVVIMCTDSDELNLLSCACLLYTSDAADE